MPPVFFELWRSPPLSAWPLSWATRTSHPSSLGPSPTRGRSLPRLPMSLASPASSALSVSPGAAPAALLSLEGIDLSFRGVQAISNLSFSVAAGEICGLIGPNGAGKSSLLNVISGVYVPQRGQIHFDGRAIGRMNPRGAAQAGIARTFQNIALFKGMSV